MNPASRMIRAIIALILLHQCAAVYEEFYPGERDAMIQLRESVKSTVIDLHSRWTGPPCIDDKSYWVGVVCSNSHVVHIVLDGYQLTGSLPATFLEDITYLTLLSFRNNSLSGSLPSLAGLLHLRQVFLSHNLFSGSIPFHYINLPELMGIQLQENKLSGTIPPFDQPDLVVFNVSHNALEGSIPQTAALQRFGNDSFGSNLQLCGKPLVKTCAVAAPPPSLSPQRKKRLTVLSIALIAVSAALLPFIIVLIILCYFKKLHLLHGKEKDEDKSDELKEKKMPSSTGKKNDPERRVELEFFDKETPRFDVDDLLRASAEMMGKGNIGTTYKVTIDSGLTVAVKRLKDLNGLDKKGFVQQLQLLGKMRHQNLARIVSFYYSDEEKMIVYEYIPCDGSLFELLHVNRGTAGRLPLSWRTRLSIVKGTAEGLAYLHESLPSHKVPHANLKSTNILICHHSNSNNNQIYLTEFGFLPLLPSRKDASEKLFIGRSPEFSQGKKLTHKADVYCFGIILLELITGREVPERNDDPSIDDLADWVKSIVDYDWSTDMLDLELQGTKEAHGEMMKLVEIARDCVAWSFIQTEVRDFFDLIAM